VLVNHPLLVIVEAKRQITMDFPESEAELFGQLRVLMMKEYVRFANFANGSGQRPRTGIITDGIRWKVYHMEISENFGIYFKEFIATNKSACFTILGTPFFFENC